MNRWSAAAMCALAALAIGGCARPVGVTREALTAPAAPETLAADVLRGDIARGGILTADSITADPFFPWPKQEDEVFAAVAKPRGPYRPASPDVLRGDGNEDLYTKCVMGISYISWPIAADKIAIGTGSLIDRQRRLVLTAAHVVKGTKTVSIFFPKSMGDHVEADASTKTRGTVLKYNLAVDLALVQLDQAPSTAVVIALADEGARPGADVVSIGHPSEGAMWSFNQGSVRNVELREWASDAGSHKARVLLLQNPINPGDSGGPILNKAGQLVAVNHGKRVQQGIDLLAVAINLDEIKAFIADVPDKPEATAPVTRTDTTGERGTPLDLNKNGKTDAIRYDFNKNGKADAVAYDKNEDGKVDFWAYDRNEDGYLDLARYDPNGDGHFETFLFDNDQDGLAELKGVDARRAGQPAALAKCREPLIRK